MSLLPVVSLGEGLGSALISVKDAIRADPSNSTHRAAYFQLLCVAGDWDRAQDQLKLVEELDPGSALFAQVYYRAVRCEIERLAVFKGKAEPVIFGEPSEWLGPLLESFRSGVRGDWSGAAMLQTRAFEMAPPTAGNVNGASCAWIADSDSRFGPILEAFIEGHYRWVPFERVQRLEAHAPRDVIDAVWLPVKFTWTNEGTCDGLIPVRYSGSESSESEAVQMARRTEWTEKAQNFYVGSGQKALATDVAEYAVLDLREIVLG